MSIGPGTIIRTKKITNHVGELDRKGRAAAEFSYTQGRKKEFFVLLLLSVDDDGAGGPEDAETALREMGWVPKEEVKS